MDFSIKEEPQLGGRGGTIGGTSWGPILGMSKYRTPHDIWMRVKGIEDKVPQNAAMRRGVRLEPIVSDVAAKNLELDLRSPERETTYWSEPYTNFTASVDRDAYKPTKNEKNHYVGPVELKTMSDYGTWGDCGPAEYRLQLQSYIWCRHLELEAAGTGEVNQGWLACVQASDSVFSMIRTTDDAEHAIAAGVARYHSHRFERDPVFMDEVIPYAQWWWKTYVDGNKPPPTDGSSASLEALHKHFGFSTDNKCEITPKLKSLAVQYQSAELELSRINKDQREKKALRDKVKAELIDAMNGHGRASNADLVIDVSISRGSDLDKKRLREERPEIFTEFSKLRNPSARVKIYRKEGD